MLIVISRMKQPKHTNIIAPPMVKEGESLWVVSFDGSARAKRKGGAYSEIVWKFPEWKIVNVAADSATDLTVNEAECRSLLLGSDPGRSSAGAHHHL